MPANWYLIQYTYDLRRHEPRNVGIAVHGPDEWHFRFVGEDERGVIHGKKLRARNLDRVVFESWVDFYKRQAMEGRWADLLSEQGRLGGNFRITPGGIRLIDDEPWGQVADSLFRELVADEAKTDAQPSLKETVRQLLAQAAIVPQEGIELDGKWSEASKPVRIPFEFGYQNGRYHAMEPITHSRKSVTDLKARIDAVTRAGKKPNFVVFYSNEMSSGNAFSEEFLMPIEEDAHSVNVDDEAQAISDLQEMMLH